MRILTIIFIFLAAFAAYAEDNIPPLDENMQIAMKSFEVGPPQAIMKIYPKNEIAAGASVTNHVLLETGDALLAEDETVITKD